MFRRPPQRCAEDLAASPSVDLVKDFTFSGLGFPSPGRRPAVEETAIKHLSHARRCEALNQHMCVHPPASSAMHMPFSAHLSPRPDLTDLSSALLSLCCFFVLWCAEPFRPISGTLQSTNLSGIYMKIAVQVTTYQAIVVSGHIISWWYGIRTDLTLTLFFNQRELQCKE